MVTSQGLGHQYMSFEGHNSAHNTDGTHPPFYNRNCNTSPLKVSSLVHLKENLIHTVSPGPHQWPQQGLSVCNLILEARNNISICQLLGTNLIPLAGCWSLIQTHCPWPTIRQRVKCTRNRVQRAQASESGPSTAITCLTSDERAL